MSELSTVVLQGLLESGQLKPVQGSLLHGWKPPFAGEATARVEAVAALDPLAREAAGILAYATGALELAEVKRGAAPFVSRLYLREARACAAAPTAAGVRFEPPLAVSALVDRLTARLSSRPGGAKSVALLPSEVSLIAYLWDGALGTPRTLADCCARLEQGGIDARSARTTLELLQSTKLLQPGRRGWLVGPREAEALEAFWSGQVLELCGGTLDGAQRETLVFVGAEAQRFLLERVPAATWRRAGQRAASSDEDLLVFRRPSRRELKDLLSTFVRRSAGAE